MVTPAPLRAGEVRVLWALLEEAPTPDSLDARERERAAAMGSRRVAGGFRAGRALARELLSRCARGVAPREWTIRPEPGGRPSVVAPAAGAGLALSISHGRTAVAAAVARTAVGVDVEGARTIERPLALAARFFAPAETGALEELAPAAQLAAFLDLWVLKEALGKACGRGMAAVMGRAAFRLAGPEGEPAARWGHDLERELGAADGWRFRLLPLPDAVRLAAAARGATEIRVERYRRD